MFCVIYHIDLFTGGYMGHFMKVVTRTQILKPKEMLKYVPGCLDKALYFSFQKTVCWYLD